MDVGVPGCFLAGTLVLTATGPVPIEDVEPGAQVWSYDHESETWELREVLATHNHVYVGDLVTIAVETGEGASLRIDCTGGHPFWVVAGDGLADRPPCTELLVADSAPTPGGRWVDARWLRLGDRFLTRTGVSATVAGLTIRLERVRVYNLHVQSLQLYAVGQDGVLVHNSGLKITYDPRLRRRMLEDPTSGHIFPTSFDPVIVNRPPSLLTAEGYAQWDVFGWVNGKPRIFEIGGYDIEGGLHIIHRLCRSP